MVSKEGQDAERGAAIVKKWLSNNAEIRDAVKGAQKLVKGMRSGGRIEFDLIEIKLQGFTPPRILVIGAPTVKDDARLEHGLLPLLNITSGQVEVLREAIVGKGEIRIHASGPLSPAAKQYITKTIGDWSKKKVFFK